MRRPRLLLAASLCAAAAIPASCTDAEILAYLFGSCDLSRFAALFLIRTPFASLFREPGAKVSRIRPEYLVHWAEMDFTARTCSVHLSRDFGQSTPLTFGVKANRTHRTWVVDRRKPMPGAETFVKERLEELSAETFTVSRVVVTGSARVPKRSDEVPFRIKVTYRAKVETGTKAGRSFSGTLSYSGAGADFGGE